MAPGPSLILDIAEKRFPGAAHPLLSSFRLTIEPGSIVALYGSSGIGKSTLLRLVAGIDRDYAGSIAIDAQPAHQAPPPGFVFQDPRLLPWLTASDNVRMANPAISREAARATLAQVGLGDHAQAWPRQLSGGMQRRVAVARALATNPRLLLLDEPFVSLDRPLVDSLHLLLADLVDRDRPTMLFASHQREDVARLADRVIVLGGRPAGITLDLAFPVSRRERDAACLSDYARRLESLLPI